MNKDRGKFLTASLVLMIILMSFTLYSSTSVNYQELYKNAPSWTGSLMLVWSIIDVAALVGIWLWKKWAVYLYIVSFILGGLSEILILHPIDLSPGYFGLILYGLVFWAINRKWKLFV